MAQTFGYCFQKVFKIPVNINFETTSQVVILLLKDLWRIIYTSQILKRVGLLFDFKIYLRVKLPAAQ